MHHVSKNANILYMQKSQAIELLGGTVGQAAEAIGINSQAISQWPEELPPRLVDRVIAACVRKGIKVPAWALRSASGAKESA